MKGILDALGNWLCVLRIHDPIVTAVEDGDGVFSNRHRFIGEGIPGIFTGDWVDTECSFCKRKKRYYYNEYARKIWFHDGNEEVSEGS